MLRIGMAMVLLLLLGAGDLEAQRTSTLRVGNRARVELPPASPADTTPSWVAGRVVRVGSDSLWLHLPGDSLAGYAAAALPRVQVRVPRSVGSRAGRGGLIGMGVGFVAGFAFPQAMQEGGSPGVSGAETMIFGMLGAAAGGAVGAVVGAILPGSRWIPARLPE